MAQWEADVRKWAWDNGVECSSRGRLPKRVIREFLEANPDSAEAILRDAEDWMPPSEDAEVSEAAPLDETPPKVGHVRPGERFTAWRNRAAKPKPKGRKTARVSGENILAYGWSALAGVVSKVAPGPGVIMMVQAPVAGAILDEAVAGLPPDKLLQVAARNSGRGKMVGALVMPPALVFAMQQNPGRIPVLMPMLRSALFNWMEIAGPHIQEVKEKNERLEKEYGADVDDVLVKVYIAITGEMPPGYVPPTDEYVPPPFET